MTVDTRWRTTPAEVDQFLEKEMGRRFFALTDIIANGLNPNGLRNWDDPRSPQFLFMTRPQQVLWLVATGLGEVSNGGINQLFGNWFDNMDQFRDAFVEFDWPGLTARFVPIYDATYGNPAVAARMKQTMMGVHGRLHGGDPKGAWDDAKALYRTEEGAAFDMWFYANWAAYRQEQYRYIQANADQFVRYD
jgi:hypothetical protein